MSTINTANSQLYNNVRKEDSAISSLNSYLDKNNFVFHADENTRNESDFGIGLGILGPFALFSLYKLTTGSEKQLEGISSARFVSLEKKLIYRYNGSDHLFFGFDRNCSWRQEE